MERFGGRRALGDLAHDGLRLGGKGDAPCLAVDQGRPVDPRGTDSRLGQVVPPGAPTVLALGPYVQVRTRVVYRSSPTTQSAWNN